MAKYLSVILILTMMTGLCAAYAYAEADAIARGVTVNIQRYGADLAAQFRPIDLMGLAFIRAKLAAMGQAAARQAAGRISIDGELFAAEIPHVAEPIAILFAGSGGGGSPMSIERVKSTQTVPLLSAVNRTKSGSPVRLGQNQTSSIPRIRGHDGARAGPAAPDSS